MEAPRLYQWSLRTILEIVAVVAIMLAFVFQRGQPSGRYPVSSYGARSEHGAIPGCYVADTKTGQVWHIAGTNTPTKVPPLP